ncbi:hypothetical protein HZR23_05395 [Serpentinicella alkaliphila]|uniref:hypothetical protein n=1 Tax=Serpentinicella alkaliphila TaxID=1734049 RepID=UPI00104BF496|nr:hypothetical protein [Serpentinicella alkaliphila]QUH25253.1 hypothetical protein HZR23_05395 [Serpentinicella alkaliphila]
MAGNGENGDTISFNDARTSTTHIDLGWDFTIIWVMDSTNTSFPHFKSIYSVVQSAGIGSVL